MASGSSASLPSLHSSISPSPSASSSTTSAPTTADSDANLSNNAIAPLGREVRFYERCVLIPERPSSRPFVPHRLRTGTLEVNLNLPFSWKWPVLGSPSPKEKHFPSDMHESHAESDEGVLGAGVSVSPPRIAANSTRHEAAQPVVLKLPYPIFRRKSHSPAHSSVVLPRSCLRHSTSPPSSAISTSFGHRNTSPDADADRSSSSGPRKPQRRSASLPSLPLDPNVETIPLRPCCEKCLAASEVHWNRNPLQKRGRLPTLQESSREHTPSQSRLDLREEEEEEEDWCAGLHFTKGALKLWRSASVDRSGALPAHAHALRQFQEGPAGAASGKLLNSLVRVDEVDRKRSSSPNTSVIALTEDEKDAQSRSNLMITMPNLDRLKRIDRFDPPSPTGSGSEDTSEEDLFPLPSPNRLSPAVSPSDSATCLPAQITGLGLSGSTTEPRQFEAAIRAKMAEKDKRVEKAKAQADTVVSASAALSASNVSSNLTRSLDVSASASSTSAPIPIPGPHLKEGVSYFHSNLDEIEWDPSLPDPDALLPDSTILLNSPPGSPMLSPSSGAGINYGIDDSNEGDKHAHQLPASLHSLPQMQMPRPHIPSVHLPLSPRRRHGSGSGTNLESPSPASVPASTSVPGLYIPPTSLPSYSSAPVPPASAPAMHGLTQSRSNTEELASSPPSPQMTRRRASVSNIMRAGVNALRGLSPTSSVSVGSEAAGGVSYSRGLIV
ncbi:hypothetical protein A7U60_g3036 [Sanghuangporus baumii]|uniref:Uncharacterized protein n=1 Tax=Sanghuangporus baumii TaxID=108892 RepID=A0A9Q5NAG0_SANBA|nr:hypothetical protein A7U60_g3036 [Sanghuangporus baumii]